MIAFVRAMLGLIQTSNVKRFVSIFVLHIYNVLVKDISKCDWVHSIATLSIVGPLNFRICSPARITILCVSDYIMSIDVLHKRTKLFFREEVLAVGKRWTFLCR